jgi:hypothetical protein
MAHKNVPKTQKQRVFLIPLKNVLSVMDPVNLPGTPKLWAIAYENNHQRKNNEFFCHASQTCTECHGPCKSA